MNGITYSIRPGRILKVLLFGLLIIPSLMMSQEQIEKKGSDPLQNAIRTDSTEVRALLKKSEDLRFANPDSSIILARRAIELADNIDFEVAKAEGFKLIGLVFGDRNSFGDAMDYFNRSLAVYRKEKDTSGISNLQSNIGSVYQTTGDDPKALEFFMESLKNAEIVNDPRRIGTAYVNLGTVYANDELTYDQAIENYVKSIPYFEEDKYPLGLAVANVNIGESYLKQAALDKKKGETNRDKENATSSIPFLEDALKGFREVGIDPATPLNLLAEAFRRLDQFGQAQDYYEQAIASAKERGTKSEEAISYIGLGNTFIELENPSRAIRYFNEGLQVANSTNLLRQKGESYEGLSEAYAMNNDFVAAYRAQQQYTVVQDSLRNESYAEQMTALRNGFDLQQKEKEIELLNAKNELNQIQIEEDARAKQLFQIIIGLFLAIIAGFVFQYFYIRRTNKRLAFERNRSEEILLNILPKETAEELKENGFIKAKEFEHITVLFTDFKAFSLVAERISAENLVKSVDYYFKTFDEITERHGLEKIKTIGDAYMCAGGIPTSNTTHVRDSFGAAREILKFVNDTELSPPPGIYPFRIRIGLNSGPVVAGVVGTKKFAYDIWGNTVNIAARMESGSVPGRINVSESIYEELKEEFPFTYRGELKVKDQVFKMYFADVPETIFA